MKIAILLTLLASWAQAETKLINGKPAGKLFPAVGTFNMSCTITKVGTHQFITAAHCIDQRTKSLTLSFNDFKGRVNIISHHLHPSWIKDCSDGRCSGREVGSERMTPGRSDVALINVKNNTSAIPVYEINYSPIPVGTEVAMVGSGCTRNITPAGKGKMRYALTKLIPASALIHEHSLYRNISQVTGQSNWITPGYKVSQDNASLCPGDSGGPLLTKNEQGEWTIIGVAADYTFYGPYKDGEETVTNLHTRLDDESHNQIGAWIRSVWE